MNKLKEHGHLVIAIIALLAFMVPFNYSDPTFDPYVDWYMSIVDTFCTPDQYSTPIQQSILFEDLEGDAVGVCIRYGFGYAIQIDKDFWDRSDIVTRQILISHELTHCLFKMGHLDNPHSFMYPSVVRMSTEELIEQVAVESWNHCVSPSISNR